MPGVTIVTREMLEAAQKRMDKMMAQDPFLKNEIQRLEVLMAEQIKKRDAEYVATWGASVKTEKEAQ